MFDPKRSKAEQFAVGFAQGVGWLVLHQGFLAPKGQLTLSFLMIIIFLMGVARSHLKIFKREIQSTKMVLVWVVGDSKKQKGVLRLRKEQIELSYMAYWHTSPISIYCMPYVI